MIIAENSQRGLKWKIKITNKNNIEDHLLFLNSPMEKESFFKKSLKDNWPKSGEIDDIDKAINIIVNALKNNLKVGIVGDYDVDGSSATGLLIAYFRKINLNFTYHIPNRFTEGYGISPGIIDKLIDQSVDIIITVDNGTTAYEAIAHTKKHNKKIIIMDHHHLQNPIEVDAFINPHQKPIGFEILCATGIVFIFLVELNNYLFQNNLISENINVYNYIDVAATATICDVMPLIGINRAIVATGIKKMNLKPIPGYGAVLKGKIGQIDTQTIGFSLGPCINAPGRLGSAAKAVELVVEEDEIKAKQLAEDLVYMNHERKRIEKEVSEKALEQIEKLKINEKKSIVVYGDWFEGVIGIVAGRLKDKYNKPTCVFTLNQGHWKASLRSVEGFHIGNAVKKAIDNGIALFGGGHEMAGGISIAENKLEEFIEFFENEVCSTEIKPVTELEIDAIISLSSIESIYKILEDFAPFGPNNPEPLFMFPNCIIKQKKSIKTSVLITFQSPNFENSIDCWLFASEVDKAEVLQKDQNIHVVGYIVKNQDKFQIKIIDFIIV